jgi:hypothetical protein
MKKTLLIVTALVLSLDAAERKTQHVILVTADGLRWQELFGGIDTRLLTKEAGAVTNPAPLKKRFARDTPEAAREALLPFIWSVIAKEGQIFGNPRKNSDVMVTNGKNFSYPGYNEILAGFVDPRVHTNDLGPNPNVTALEWLHAKPGMRGRIAAFAGWVTFKDILHPARSGLTVSAGREAFTGGKVTARTRTINELMMDTTPPNGTIRHDSFTFALASEYLTTRKPRVLYVAFTETDDWAHDGRYADYLAAAHLFDEFLKRLWTTIESMSEYRGRTTLIVTADHGRGEGPGDWKGHGVKVPASNRIWLLAIGPDTKPLGERAGSTPITQSQVAATVAALVGHDYVAAVPKAAPPVADIVAGR